MNEAGNYFLEFEGIILKRDDTILLNNISFQLRTGEFLVVAGSDIGGKTSLLKSCIGLINPDKGVVKINGRHLKDFSYQELQKFRQKTGFVFQDGVLLSNLTVSENIALPLRYYSKLTDKAIDKTAREYIGALNLKAYADERPAGLSAEIKLLTNLARALVVEPDLLLLDELFASLTKNNIVAVIDYLKAIKDKRRMTCLATTNTVNLISSFPEEPLIDSLMVIESDGVVEIGNCQAVREKLWTRVHNPSMINKK